MAFVFLRRFAEIDFKFQTQEFSENVRMSFAEFTSSGGGLAESLQVVVVEEEQTFPFVGLHNTWSEPCI